MQDINPGLQEDARSHFLNYLQLLWFRRAFILIFMLGAAALGVLWVSQQHAVYESTASLRIGTPEEAGGTRGAAIDEIRGEIEVLQSRALATEVIQNFQLQVYGEFNPDEKIPAGWLDALVHRIEGWFGPGASGDDVAASASEAPRPVVDRFLEKLSVERVGDSRVVRVAFRSHDPELAAQIANATAAAYIAARQAARIQASESASDFLTAQYLQLKEQLAASERAEAFYRDTFELAETERLDRFESELSDLNSRLLIARSRGADATERLAEVKALANGSLPAAADATANAAPIRPLLERREALAQQAQRLAADRPEDDPERVATANELADLNARIRSELDRLVIGLQNEAAAATAEVIELEQQLADLTLESSTLHRRLLQLRELERETEVGRVRLDAVAQRLQEDSFSAALIQPDSEVISPAVTGTGPLYPGRTQRLLSFVLAGLGLGVLIILVQQWRNPGLLSPEHVHFVLRERTIGVIPAVSEGVQPHDLPVETPDAEFSKAVAALKMTLDLTDLDRNIGAVQFVSAAPGEGRASLAVALARAEALANRRVLLVSAHLRESSIEEKIGVERRSPGLTDWLLSDDGELEQFVQRDSRTDMDFLSAGTAEYANPDVVFSSQRMQAAVKKMRADYDFVVFDTPPVMTTADAIAIGRMVDLTLFVVRWNKTPKQLVGGALRQLREGGIEIAGVVLQHVNLQRYGNIGFSDFGYLYHQKR